MSMNNCTCVFTEDTQRRLEDGEGVFFNEDTGDYYDSKLRLLVECFRRGMRKQAIVEALDIENDEVPFAGYIYWTAFDGDPCPVCEPASLVSYDKQLTS
ncbi:hypothetical protein ACTWQB_16545 [Piscibacillus sp. B03]|uniref:hypothetical protein n=1 Tax=Piscibacillus sp. B03 TaxID=3457430 RepID=UPI003FCC2CD9